MMEKVRKECREVDNKLQVRIASKEYAKDHPEFYVGTRRRKDTCIIEPPTSHKVVGEKRGKARYYLITYDSQIYKDQRSC